MYNCVVLHTFNVYVYVYNGRGKDETQNETSHLFQGISASRLASFLIVNRVVEKSHTPTTTHNKYRRANPPPTFLNCYLVVLEL